MEPQQKESVFRTVFYYCGLIILGPIAIFFATKVLLLDGLFGLSSVASNVWAAVVAIFALHIMLGMYIYRAYTESTKVKPEKLD